MTPTQRQRMARRHAFEMIDEAAGYIEAAAGFAHAAGDEDLSTVLDEVAATLREAVG